MKKAQSIEVVAALMAARFAQRVGLPAGNLWEPGIARGIARDLRMAPAVEVESAWTFRLFGEER